MLDIVFRFPHSDDAGADFVVPLLNFARVPILAVNRRARVRLSNLQGEELLLRLGSDGAGEGRGGRSRGFPSNLKGSIAGCLKAGRAVLVPEAGVKGVLGGSLEALLCPGEVSGEELVFIVLQAPQLGTARNMGAVLDQLLNSFDAPVVIVDSDMRFRALNRSYATVFGLDPLEAIGARIRDINPSKQAEVLEDQIRHLMATRQVRNSKADRLTTSKHGAVVVAISAWPVCDGPERCGGIAAIVRPVAPQAMDVETDVTSEHVFGQAAATMGPPMFLTHLDRTILIANAQGKALLRDDRDEKDLGAAIAWRHPGIIEKLYDDIAGGSGYSAILTEIETPAGTGVFRVMAHALKEIGDITSQVLIHLVDVTDAEQMRGILTSTVRNLATEKAILSKTIEGIQVAYAVVDRDLRILRVSDSVSKGFGLPLEAFVGKKVQEVDPTAGEKGIVGCIKAAIDRGHEVRLPRLAYTIRPSGRHVVLALSFFPIEVGGGPACLIAVESLTEREQLRTEAARTSGVHRAVLDGVDEGIAVIDPKGNILDVNRVVQNMIGRDRKDIIGKNENELLAVEESDLLRDFRLRATLSCKPLNTGDLKLTDKPAGKSIFVNITFIPMLAPDGSLDRITVIIRFLTDVVNLERKIEEYTKNLEKLVAERTKELTTANDLLGGTVEKLASMAQSGMVLSSLKDTESVMASFLEEAGEVLGADFVSVALIEAGNGTSKTTYYSRGPVPPRDDVPAGIVETALARLTIGEMSDEVARPEANILTAGFNLTDHRGLLLAWKREGEFTEIDMNLGRLLCTQLGFSLPITRYVTDLRRERDRSQALRRIGFQVAGTSSVLRAIKIVAVELSRILPADRFFWLVSKSGEDIWVTEIYRPGGVPARDATHLASNSSGCLRPVLEACRVSHQLFCERLPHLGGSGADRDWPGQGGDLCPFAEETERAKLVKCIKELLGDAGMLGKDTGALVAAPVTLSSKSWGMLCAHKGGGTFSGEDACFMCLAAASVGHMWEAADAASNVRQLKVAGETVSELAHDLKYPLMKLRESITNLSGRTPAAAEKDPGITRIREEIERLALLANELIEVSNTGDRKYELVDIGEMIEQCLSLTAVDSESKSVSVEKRVDGGVPAVFASKKDVKLVLLNILANCIDAAGPGGSVGVEATKGETPAGVECVILTFSDSGPGVPADQISRIFDPFYTRREGGSGLGLFSAKKRARANGGDVVCDIGLDGRTRFVVQFPRASE